MTLFRRVRLPDRVAGGLYLYRMPGRCNEPLEWSWTEVKQLGISQILCLAPEDEIARKLPAYAAAIAENELPCRLRQFPIPDYSAPADLEALRLLAQEIADALRRGENVLVHCGAGVGRTGTVAVAVLLALGVPLEEARETVRAAGSYPETEDQREALRRLAALFDASSSR